MVLVLSMGKRFIAAIAARGVDGTGSGVLNVVPVVHRWSFEKETSFVVLKKKTSFSNYSQ